MANFNVALPGQYITPLTFNENLNDYSVRYNVPFSVLQVASSTTSGDTVTLSLGTTPTNWVVPAAYAWVGTQFVGASVTSMAMTLGTTTTANAFLASTAVTSASGTLIQATNGINTVNTPTSSTGVASVTTQAVFTLQGAGANALSAGFVQIVLQSRDLTATY